MSDVPIAIDAAADIWTSEDRRLMDATELRLVTQSEWVSLARLCPAYNFQQSPAYSVEIANRRGAACEFVTVRDARYPDQVVGLASVRLRSVPIIGGGVAYVSGGPLLREPFNAFEGKSALQRILDALAREYVVRRGLCLRVTMPTMDSAASEGLATVFEVAGFQNATGTPYRTILVDLRRSMDEIRATLDRKWRNQLTAALRGNFSVDLSKDASAVARFAPLLEETSQRKGFRTELDAFFYDRVQRSAEPEERMLVAIANADDNDIAGVVASVIGQTAVYILGATTAASLKSKAAYGLHWRVMEAARDAGCHWYDLGGIDPQANPGVYHFKSGFGGQEIVSPGPFEIRPAGFAGTVSRITEQSYLTLKRWRS